MPFLVDSLKLDKVDAAFILGKAGKTKAKISRVSGAKLELNDLTLTISGTDVQRKRAKKYVECLVAQRSGPVSVVPEDHVEDDDLTILQVPNSAVGFVTGAGGNFLRMVEEEWGTLMFFADHRGRPDAQKSDQDTEMLAIFGNQRARRGAELKVMAAVDSKIPNHFAQHIDATNEEGDEEFGSKYVALESNEISYALGKRGMTRKKLAKSSGCIVEYVSNTVCLSGTIDERRRASEYLVWLFEQLKGPLYVEGWESREDCTCVEIPSDCIGYVTGARRATLGKIEEEFGVLMFFMNSTMRSTDREAESAADPNSSEKLAIFGPRRDRRGAELKSMSAVETKRPGFFTADLRNSVCEREDFASDTILLEESDLSYALGRDGTTRRKLARAAGVIMEFVGKVAFICGSGEERHRGRDYLTMLLTQRVSGLNTDLFGSLSIEIRNRDDVKVVKVPTDCVGFITGHKGASLRRVEDESGTFCFIVGDGGGERLYIFSHDSHSRDVAEKMITKSLEEKRREDSREGRRDRDRDDRDYHRHRRDSRDYDRRRDDDDDRRRDSYDRRRDDYDRRRDDVYSRRRRDDDYDRRRDSYDRRDRRRDEEHDYRRSRDYGHRKDRRERDYDYDHRGYDRRERDYDRDYDYDRRSYRD